jgi:hypothetical protein
MLPELLSRRRHTMDVCVFAAAIERPIVIAQTAADQASALEIRHAAQRDVGFPGTQIPHVLALVEFDHDVRVTLVQFAQHRRQQDHENVLRG